MQYKAWFIALACIVLVGLYLRLETVKHTNVDTPIRADAKHYTAYAYNLKLHGVYSRDISTIHKESRQPEPDALRSPGYPTFLSLLVVPNNLKSFITRTVYVQALISGMTLLLIAYIAYVISGIRIAAFVTLLAAISPHLTTINTFILTETLFTFFLLSTLAATTAAIQKNRLILWGLSALLLSFAALTRPTMQFFIIFLAAFAWYFSSHETRRKNVAIVIVVFIGTYTLWFLRNLITLGELSDPTLTINALHHGMYPGFLYNNQPHTFGFPYHYDPDSPYISASVSNALSAILDRFIN
ncbi:MAG: hypothetical protein EP297_01735, partial [Gammaproteobacteria bacterium]